MDHIIHIVVICHINESILKDMVMHGINWFGL